MRWALTSSSRRGWPKSRCSAPTASRSLRPTPPVTAPGRSVDCGHGPVIAVAGRFVHTSIRTTVGALLDGEPVRRCLATDPVALPPGQEELLISPAPRSSSTERSCSRRRRRTAPGQHAAPTPAAIGAGVRAAARCGPPPRRHRGCWSSPKASTPAGWLTQRRPPIDPGSGQRMATGLAGARG